jgi:TonB family protein
MLAVFLAASVLLPASGIARARNWEAGTIIEISQGYAPSGSNTTWNPDGTSATTKSTGFKYVDYAIQTDDRIVILRSNATLFSHVLSDVGNISLPHTGNHSSASVPVSIGEQVKVAIEGNKGWILDWREKEHGCSVVRQSLITGANPPATVNQPTSQAAVPGASSVEPQQNLDRPTLRRNLDDDLPPPPTIQVPAVSPEPVSIAGLSRSSTITPPILISKVEPSYSEEAQQAGIEGTVILKADVWADGFAHNFRVVQSVGHGLDEKAIEAVSKWRFQPGTKDGKPVAVVSQFEVSFKLLGKTLDSDHPASTAPSPQTLDEHQAIPGELAEQSAAYMQRRLHVWQVGDAQAELGRPTNHRIASDQNDRAYGEVFSYTDPTKRYRQFDLTFDFESKKLREVRVFPWHVTLDQCKQIWGDRFEEQRRPDGIRLYVYRYQRVSVLARDTGEVLSFDLW